MTLQTQSCKKTKNESAISQDSFVRFFEILWLLELSKGISLDLRFSCFGIYNKNNKPLLKNRRLLFSHNKESVSSMILQKMILRAVIIQLYCFTLVFEKHLLK